MELLEDALLLYERDAEPVVADGEADAVVDVAQRDLDRAAAGRVFDRIFDEVDKHLFHLLAVGGDSRRRIV